MAEGLQEKTEKATGKKRRETRQEGQVVKSVEVISVAVLLAGLLALYFGGKYIYVNLEEFMKELFSFESVLNLNDQYIINLLIKVLSKFVLTVLPVFAAVFLIALAVNIVQVGFVISFKAISPKFNKLNFITGFAKLFSLKSFVEALKSFLKLIVVGGVAYFSIKGEIDIISHLYDKSLASIYIYILNISFKIFIWVIIVMMVIAIFDYIYQKWQFEQQIKMTKEEVKEERKQMEGDPKVKAKIRSIQLDAARKRMMQDVSDADVIVTNPTHLSIAIKYDSDVMSVPKVVAKGAGIIAEKIKEIAKKSNVPVVENKELARNLYGIVEVGSDIPSELFQAVAQLLAYVYKLKGKI